MNNYREIVTSMLWRLVPTLGVGAVGFFLLASASRGSAPISRLMLGMACLITASTIIAPSIASLIAEPTGELYFPSATRDRPPPMYSIGETKRKKGLHQEAFDYFACIAAEFPHELKPYVEMMDIAIVDMKNRALAEQAFLRGLASLVDEQDRRGLCAMHEAIISRLVQDAPNLHLPIKVKQQMQNQASDATSGPVRGAEPSSHQG